MTLRIPSDFLSQACWPLPLELFISKGLFSLFYFYHCFPLTALVLGRVPVTEKDTLSVHVGDEYHWNEASSSVSWDQHTVLYEVFCFFPPKAPFHFHNDFLKTFGLNATLYFHIFKNLFYICTLPHMHIIWFSNVCSSSWLIYLLGTLSSDLTIPTLNYQLSQN